jgi:hypothetical protein
MGVSLVRTSAGGIRRYFSPFMASAFLMLLGGYLLLYNGDGTRRWAEVHYVFLTQLGYQVILLLMCAYLYRKLSLLEEPLMLLGILGVFVMDVLFIQHLYGWEPGVGFHWSTTASISSVALLLGASAAMGFGVGNRLLWTACAVVLFFRLGPAVLPSAPVVFGVSLGYVALGWMLAGCLVPILVLPRPATRKLDCGRWEPWALAVTVIIGIAHFMSAGNSMDLAFSVVYLAPFVVVLPLALERLSEGRSRSRAFVLLCDGLPLIGMFLTAVKQAPPVWDVFHLGEGPLTPFWLVALLAAVVSIRRSIVNRRSGLLHAAALALAFLCLGGNLSEVLVRLRFPDTWQLVTVLAISVTAALLTRQAKPALLLHLLPAFALSCWMAERGYPLVPGLLMALCWGLLLLEPLTGTSIGWKLRAGVVLFLLGTSLLVGLAEPHSTLRLIVCATSCCALGGWGLLPGRRLQAWSALAASIGGTVAYPIVLQSHSGASSGKICIQLAFLLLIVGFIHAIYGSRVRDSLQEIASQAAQSRGTS